MKCMNEGYNERSNGAFASVPYLVFASNTTEAEDFYRIRSS